MNDDLDLMGGAMPPVDDEKLEEDDELEDDEELEDEDEDIEKVKPASEEEGDVSLEDLGEEKTKKNAVDMVDDEGNPQF